MPRKSAEERGASIYRSGAVPPRPPRNLGRTAADHWATIVQARAPDHFDGSVQGLLANYCSALAESGRVAAAMAAEAPGTPVSAALTKDFATLTGLAASLARQLRLTKTSPLDKKAG